MMPRVVYLYGVDGVGKTALSQLFCEEFNKQGVKTRYVWLRFSHYVSRIVNAFGRLIGFSYREQYDDGTVVGYHDYYRSSLLSWLYICAVIIDTYFVSFIAVRLPTIGRRKVLVLDRFVCDVMVDLFVDTRKALVIGKRAWHFMRRLLPKKSLIVYVVANKTTVYERRPDVLHDKYFDIRAEKYAMLSAQMTDVAMIRNDGSLEESRVQMQELIRDYERKES